MSTQISPIDRRRRRLIWVRYLRRGLPALAVLMVAGIVAQIGWSGLMAVLHPSPAVVDQQVHMTNPTFSGQGRDGSRYRLTARAGVRDAADDKRILLDQPHITASRDGQADTNTVSEHGVFQEDAHTLRLTGNVRVLRGGGYQFATNDATIDTTTGQVIGQAVNGRGPTTAVQSNSYAVSDKGGVMTFKGRVHARLNDH